MSLGKSLNSFNESGQELTAADVLRLQSLEKDFPNGDFAWYLEPVEVDTFIKEESRFDVTIEILKIQLPKVESLTTGPEEYIQLSKEIFNEAESNDRPIIILEILDKIPELRKAYDHVYKHLESLLMRFKEQIAMYLDDNPRALRQATYVTETLLKFEPSLLSLRFLGDFHTYNLNWLITKMNYDRVLVNLEVDTVEYLINRCDRGSGHYIYDEDYQRLSALYLHKIRNEY